MKVVGWEIFGRIFNLGEMKVLFKRQLLYRLKMRFNINVIESKNRCYVKVNYLIISVYEFKRINID